MITHNEEIAQMADRIIRMEDGKEVNEEQMSAISAHPNVRETGQRTVIGYISTGVFAKLPAEVSYMDQNCTKWSYATPAEGHMPEGEKEISMDTDLLETMFWFFRAHFILLPVLLTIPVFALLVFSIPSVIYRQTVRQSVVERLRGTE